MITKSQADLLRRKNSSIDPENEDDAANLALLEQRKLVRVSNSLSGPRHYCKSDLGHAALREFEANEQAAIAERTLPGRARGLASGAWALLNSNVIAGAIGAAVGFFLGKIS